MDGDAGGGWDADFVGNAEDFAYVDVRAVGVDLGRRREGGGC